MRKVFALSVLFTGIALAGGPAEGNWQYVDGPRTTFIRTYEEGGQLKAVIEKVTKGGQEDAAAMCDKCSGDNKGKPMKGLVILWDTKKDGDNWKEGKLLDPESGRVVKGAVEVLDGGKKLNVKGSVAIISKTQSWTKVQ